MTKSLHTLAALLFVLGCAVPASAQSLKIPTMVYAGAAAADLTTTYYNLSGGKLEGNPALWFTQSQPVPTVIAGVACDVAAIWLIHRVLGRRHPKLATVGLYVAAGARVFFAANNFRMRPGHVR